MLPIPQIVPCVRRRSAALRLAPSKRVAAYCSAILWSRSVVVALLLALLLSGPSRTLRAEVIDSYAALETILGDDLMMEDFEGISLAGGTSIVAPNPLDSTSALSNWGIQPGVTYSSPSALALYTGQLLGDDSNVLAARGNPVSNTMNVTFGNPQLAVGFYLVNITGNLDYDETVSLYRNATVLDIFSLTLPSASELFIGRQFPGGVTSIQVTSSAFALVDNITWGLAASILAGDYNDNGTIDAADYTAWRDAMTAGTSLTNDPTPGAVGESDFAYWRAHFGDTLGSGVGSASGSVVVPEPSALSMLLMASLAMLSCRTRQFHELVVSDTSRKWTEFRMTRLRERG